MPIHPNEAADAPPIQAWDGISMGRRTDTGFTLLELMVVVLVIGILVAIALPVFNAQAATAKRNTCFGNQVTIDRAIQTYLAKGGTRKFSDLYWSSTYSREGTTVMGHWRLVDDGLLQDWPGCPAVPDPQITYNGYREQYYIEDEGVPGIRWLRTPYYTGCNTHGYYATDGGKQPHPGY